MTPESPPVVYVVCEAEYDAQGPMAVFTNAAAAEQHAADCRVEHGSRFEVTPLPFVGVVPQRAAKFVHGGRACGDHGMVEDEQAWAVDCWDYDVPVQPVVTVDVRYPDSPRVHVVAASAEAAEAAFREAVEKVWEAGTA